MIPLQLGLITNDERETRTGFVDKKVPNTEAGTKINTCVTNDDVFK